METRYSRSQKEQVLEAYKKHNKIVIVIVTLVLLVATLIGISLGFKWPLKFSSKPILNSTWSSGKRIDPYALSPGDLNSVSCPNKSFWVAVDNNGYKFTYSLR
jgi:hypothetical protein